VSMSAYMDGPWSCGSYACPHDESCPARKRNEAEAAWLERNKNSWEQAWAEAYGAPALTMRDARTALWR
jgi:hypothetical protein